MPQGLEDPEAVGEDYNVEEADDGPRPFTALLDTGLKRTSTGSKVFAALKVCDTRGLWSGLRHSSMGEGVNKRSNWQDVSCGDQLEEQVFWRAFIAHRHEICLCFLRPLASIVAVIATAGLFLGLSHYTLFAGILIGALHFVFATFSTSQSTCSPGHVQRLKSNCKPNPHPMGHSNNPHPP